MDVFAEVEAKVLDALKELQTAGVLPDALDFGNVAVEQPRDPSHGDLACNAAMVLAKPAGKKPREIAEPLADALKADADITSADVAGPGFLNLRLSPAFWHRVVHAIVEQGARYGSSDMGQGA